jgi:hypothetical protein
LRRHLNMRPSERQGDGAAPANHRGGSH